MTKYSHSINRQSAGKQNHPLRVHRMADRAVMGAAPIAAAVPRPPIAAPSAPVAPVPVPPGLIDARHRSTPIHVVICTYGPADNSIHWKTFHDVALSISEGLRGHGFMSAVVPVDVCSPSPKWPDRCIVLAADLSQHPSLPMARALLPERCAIFNLEFIPPSVGGLVDPAWHTCMGANTRYHDTMRNPSRVVFDYSLGNIENMKRYGIRAYYMPIGAAPHMSRASASARKDIDVLLVGSLNHRRTAIVDTLRERGWNAVSMSGIYGEARDQAYARAKIALNVHYYKTNTLETVRVVPVMANRVCVVSEPGCEPLDDKPFADVVAFASYETLVDTCEKLLADEPRRKALADAGYRVATVEMNIVKLIAPSLPLLAAI